MISETLKKTILEVLKLEDFPLTEATVAADVPGWDSLSHARILAAAEQAFAVRFRSLEVIRIRNVGELQALIDKKRGQ